MKFLHSQLGGPFCEVISSPFLAIFPNRFLLSEASDYYPSVLQTRRPLPFDRPSRSQMRPRGIKWPGTIPLSPPTMIQSSRCMVVDPIPQPHRTSPKLSALCRTTSPHSSTGVISAQFRENHRTKRRFVAYKPHCEGMLSKCGNLCSAISLVFNRATKPQVFPGNESSCGAPAQRETMRRMFRGAFLRSNHRTKACLQSEPPPIAPSLHSRALSARSW